MKVEGTYLGKVMVTDYYRKDMPQHLRILFKEEFELTKDGFLSKMYQEPMPGRFLASFAKFIGKHISDPYMYELVSTGFELFITKNVMKYEGHKNYLSTLPVPWLITLVMSLEMLPWTRAFR